MEHNEINIDELERMAKAATPGPWHSPGMGEVHDDEFNCVIVDVCWREVDIDGNPVALDASVGNGTQGDADFIAAAEAQQAELVRLTRESVARAIWSVQREHEDRCDMGLDDLQDIHPVWSEADAVLAAIQAKQAEPVRLTDERIDQILSTAIPGGSQARDWFLPHDDAHGLANVRDVVRRMILRANGFKVEG